MQKLLHFLFLLFAFLSLSAQDNNYYRSTTNPYYWKNRKPFEGYWQQDVKYAIKATIDDKTDIVDGSEELTYYNNSPDTLTFVYFHLYENAFIKGGYLEQLNLANGFKQRFGKYEAEGKGTTIEYVKVNGADMKISLDYSVMKVELTEPLLPNSSVQFLIRFKTYFDDGGNQRRRMKLFKDHWGNKQYDGVHWYPRLCVYDRKFGWETDQHLGKEFYGDFGSYDVELTFPNQYVMDATGVLQNKEEVLPADLREKLDVKNFKNKPLEEKPSEIIIPNGTTKTWKFHADNVHDFAWVADPTFRIGEEEWNGVKCVSLSQEPHSARWQDAATFTARVIQTYSTDIGMYAYPKMIVADARDGMEYPMLTLDGGLSPGYFGLLAHEVGHNWFFGMVGNNETYRASLDEGFTQFLTAWSMTKLVGDTVRHGKGYVGHFSTQLSQVDQSVYLGYVRDAMKDEDAPLNTHSDDFNGALNHGGGYGHVYYKTATMLYNLQYVLGDSLFLKAMQHYFDQWKMAHPYFEDFRNSIINYTHVDLNWFFDQWLETTKHIDYKIADVKKFPTIVSRFGPTPTHSITFKRKGDMQMPVDFTVYTKDSSYKFIIPNTYFVKKTDATVLSVWKGWGILNQTYKAEISIPVNKDVKKVSIDPTYRLADINQLNNSTKCPILFTFDHQIRNPMDRKHYILKWRPEVWYNSVDGVKAGLHFNGNYMNYKHIFSATAWYNSTLGKNYDGDARHYVNYNLSYKTAVAKRLFLYANARFLDGLWLNKFGFEKTFGKNSLNIYVKSMYRQNLSDLDYLLYPDQWVSGEFNNTINLELDRNYSFSKGNGRMLVGLKSTTLGSNYDYATLFFTATNNTAVSKFDVHTRVHAQMITGSNVAPESKLFLAGANPEDMMENKFVRSRAFVPEDWLGYGATTNHFQYGGGLNVRGYAGYLLPVNYDNSQYYLTSGTTGSSINVELDFDRFIPIPPKGILKYFHMDTYLFGDGGILSNKYTINGKHTYLATDFLMSAGAGVAFTIKKWGVLDDPKPLTLRFDMPVFLSTAPYVDDNNFQFRWQVGVSRAF